MGRVYNIPNTSERQMSEMRRDGWSFLPTTEDWHPTWPGDLVAVRLFVSPTGGQITFRGKDDTVMVRQFSSAEAARRCYVRLPPVIMLIGLKLLGFRGD